MASLRYTARCLRDIRSATKSQWATTSTTLVIRLQKPTQNATRSFSTTSQNASTSNDQITSQPPPGLAELDAAMQERATAETAVKAMQKASGASSKNRAIHAPYARAVPVSPSYFSAKPIFNDSYVAVQELARKYARLPVLPRDKVAPIAWRTKAQYRLATGEHVKGRDFAACLGLVKRLSAIHPDLMPEEVKKGIEPFQREINYFLNKPFHVPVDKFGRSVASGKRKTSIARAFVVEGTGEVFVNGKPLSDAFGRLHDRESAMWALKSTERLDKYNVWAVVQGGGTTGQAEALTLAVAKALCAHEPALKGPLRKAGCITRDPRAVERKKHGHVKARKMPTWVKR